MAVANLLDLNGILTGITMLDECIADVKKQNPGNDSLISESLMKKIRVYNYIPPGVSEAYARAILEEYKKAGIKDA